nr:MAG TPA: hypothetical protein [Caudoviricetes sp.]
MVIGGSLANKGSELFVKFYRISIYIIAIYACYLSYPYIYINIINNKYSKYIQVYTCFKRL